MFDLVIEDSSQARLSHKIVLTLILGFSVAELYPISLLTCPISIGLSSKIAVENNSSEMV